MQAPSVAVSRFQSVTAYLGWDHDRLEDALRSVSTAVGKGWLREARAGYEAFEPGLLRHFRIEEELLFPVFEARSGLDGPTSVMRDEHRQVRTVLDRMRRALEESDARGYVDGLCLFQSMLSGHNAREEHILYPALDRLLLAPECERLLERLQRESAAATIALSWTSTGNATA